MKGKDSPNTDYITRIAYKRLFLTCAKTMFKYNNKVRNKNVAYSSNFKNRFFKK